MELINDHQLNFLGEQFSTIKQMTFEQFIEAVQNGIIRLDTPITAARVVYTQYDNGSTFHYAQSK